VGALRLAKLRADKRRDLHPVFPLWPRLGWPISVV